MFHRIIPALALTLLASVASAASVAAVDVSGGTDSTNGNWSLGWEFVANQNITLTELGVYDDQGNDLIQSHAVGIYNSAGTLLTSGTVVSGDALTGKFRYTDVLDVLLSAGSTYFVMAVTGSENYNFGGTVTVDPVITFVRNSFNFAIFNSGTLAFPDSSTDLVDYGFFGANFKYETAVVPVPGTLGLVAIALVGLGVTRRRRA